MNLQQTPVAHIVCHDLEGVIGRSDTNEMPWKCKQDLKYFQKITMNKICIMGYNTYRSIIMDMPKLHTIEPTLMNRICIVIADPDRVPPIENNIRCSNGFFNHYMFTKGTTYKLSSGDAYEIMGHTSFVPNLSHALDLAEIFAEDLNLLCDPHFDRKDIHNNPKVPLNDKWSTRITDPKAFIIGGGRYYNETLQHANVVRIYETTLPINCGIKKNAVKYPVIDRDHYFVHAHNTELMDISVGPTVSWHNKVDIRIWEKKK